MCHVFSQQGHSDSDYKPSDESSEDEDADEAKKRKAQEAERKAAKRARHAARLAAVAHKAIAGAPQQTGPPQWFDPLPTKVSSHACSLLVL